MKVHNSTKYWFQGISLPPFCSKDGWVTPNNRFQSALGEAYCIACSIAITWLCMIDFQVNCITCVLYYYVLCCSISLYLPVTYGENKTRDSNAQTSKSQYISPRTLQPAHKLFLHPHDSKATKAQFVV